MFVKLIKQLEVLAHSHWYWLMYIAGGFSFLAVALIFQYHFDYDPCVLCIQTRLLVTLWIMVSIIGLLVLRKNIFSAMTHISMVLIAIVFTERSYQLLGTERGFVFGDCGFDLGLPTWFAIEEWLPSVFRIETSCGYTPNLIFNITMAEALAVFSVGFVLLSISVALVFFIKPKR